MEKRFEQLLYNLMKYIFQALQLFTCLFNHGSRESVVGLWTGMEWTVRRSKTGIVEISPHIQSELEANTDSCSLAIGSLSRSQFSRSVVLKTYPHQARGLRMGTAVIPISTLYASNGRLEVTFTFTFI
jgi:hypothetical protein